MQPNSKTMDSQEHNQIEKSML